MKLGIKVFMILCFSICMVCANELSQKQILDEGDFVFLFGEAKPEAIVLSDEEMRETQGEAWLAAIGISIGVFALGCLFNKCEFKFQSPNIGF